MPSLLPSIANGCVGAWSPLMQGSAGYFLQDFSGRNNHGTLLDCETLNFNVASGNGRGLFQDGNGNFSTTPSRVSIPLNVASLFPIQQGSFSTWLRKKDFAAGPPWTITRNNNFSLYQPGANEILDASFRTTRSTTTTLPSNIGIDTWHHFAVTMAGEVWKLYFNGIETLSESATWLNPDSTIYLLANFRSDTLCYVTESYIDGTLLHNRALKPGEIGLLASGRRAAYVTPKLRIGRAGAAAGLIRNPLIHSQAITRSSNY